MKWNADRLEWLAELLERWSNALKDKAHQARGGWDGIEARAEFGERETSRTESQEEAICSLEVPYNPIMEGLFTPPLWAPMGKRDNEGTSL